MSTKLGVAGLQTMVNRHFTLTDRAVAPNDHRNYLMCSTVPYHIKVDKRPNGRLGVHLLPPDVKYSLRKPTLQDIRNGFYALLAIAIMGAWRDNSRFTPNQARFLIRLGGLKIANANEICDDLRQIQQRLAKGISPQTAIKQVIKELHFCNHDKIVEIMNAVKEMGVSGQTKDELPLITVKKVYLQDVIGKIPLKSLSISQKADIDQMVANLDDVPSDRFIAVFSDYHWRKLQSQDVDRLISSIIFYLK